MSSLNSMLKTIIQTINQHALLLNNLSTTCHKKFEKALYKSVLTRDLTKRGYIGPPSLSKAETKNEIRPMKEHNNSKSSDLSPKVYFYLLNV